MLKPSVLICDVDLVKDILTKDFQSFERNDASLSRKYDPLLSQNPFFVSGEEWKVKRKELLPAFSSSKVSIKKPRLFLFRIFMFLFL